MMSNLGDALKRGLGILPTSVPPDVNELARRIKARKRNRKVVAASTFVALVATALGLTLPSQSGSLVRIRPSTSRTTTVGETTTVFSGPTTLPPPSGLVPADSDLPRSGVCAEPPAGTIVSILLLPDLPSPRCVQVTANQTLELVNSSASSGQSGQLVTVTFAGFPPRDIAVGESTSFAMPFSSYLAVGVHEIHISLYGGAGPEVWLRS